MMIPGRSTNVPRSLNAPHASLIAMRIRLPNTESIENEKSLPRPDEILRMAECYGKPELCNYYCSRECPIGQKYVPEIEVKPLSQITLEMLDLLNKLDNERNRLIEITADGQISSDEKADFIKIQSQLNQMSKSIDSLSLWVEKALGELQF